MGFATPGQRWRNPVALQRDGRSARLWYASPIGLEPALSDVILDGVRELEKSIGLRPKRRARVVTTSENRRFIAGLRRTGEMEFGELLLRAEGQCFSICHRRDRTVPKRRLGAMHGTQDAHEISRKTASGEYRPLRSAPTLPRGWLFSGLSEEKLLMLVDLFLPGARAHRWMEGSGNLPVRSFQEVAGGQSGIYRVLSTIDTQAVREAAARCCGKKDCVRHPRWGVLRADSTPVIQKADGRREFAIPCPRPCSSMLECARQT